MSTENTGNIMYFIVNKEIANTVPSKMTRDELFAKMDYEKIISYINDPQHTMTATQAISSFGITAKNYVQCNHTFCLHGNEISNFNDELYLLRGYGRLPGYSLVRVFRGVEDNRLTQGTTDIYANIVDDGVVFNITILKMVYSDLTPEFYANVSKFRPMIFDVRVVPHFSIIMVNVFFNHFRFTNNLIYPSNENKRVFEKVIAICRDYSSHKMIQQPSYIRTELYKYQKANVNWMIEQENKQEKFILDDTMEINFHDKRFYLGHNRHGYKDRGIYHFDDKHSVESYARKFGEDKLQTFHGGCLCDSSGMGKTVQIYTLCLSKPMSHNLIIVPDRLLSHWITEFEKHIDTSQIDVMFVSGAEFEPSKYIDKYLIYVTTQLFLPKEAIEHTWDRLVVDEFHELFTSPPTDTKSRLSIDSKFATIIMSIKSANRWAVTATPFTDNDMLFNLLSFISDVGNISHDVMKLSTDGKYISLDVMKYTKYIDTFSKMYRGIMKENVCEDDVVV